MDTSLDPNLKPNIFDLAGVALNIDRSLCKDSTQSYSAELFKRSGERLVQIARSEGVEIVPYLDPALPLFSKLPAEQQQKIAETLAYYVDSMAEMRDAHKEPLVRNLQMAWRMLIRQGLRFSSEVFRVAEEQDVIEIYTLSGLQTFVSMHFFSLCSYTLEELYSVAWHDLFIREGSDNEAHLDLFRRLLANQVQGVEILNFPPHIVRERDGKRRFVNLSTPRWAAPLFDKTTGQLVGFLHAFQSHLIATEN